MMYPEQVLWGYAPWWDGLAAPIVFVRSLAKAMLCERGSFGGECYFKHCGTPRIALVCKRLKGYCFLN
jgi:hypothetical protein